MAANLNPSLSAYHKKSEKIRAGASGISAQVVYIVPSAQQSAFETAFPINADHPTYSAAKLIDREFEQYGGDDGVDILFTYRLTYGVPNSSGTLGVRPEGSEYRRGSSNAVDVPIRLHPDYITGSFADNKPGVESYLSPQPTYSHTEVVNASFFDFTQEGIIKNVGKIAVTATLADAGLSSADAGKWFLMSRDIVENGDVVEITRTWQYAENGWDTDIYESE